MKKSAIEINGSRLDVIEGFEIRCELNQDALRREGATVRQFMITDPAELKFYDHCWQYLPERNQGKNRAQAGWDWRGAKPVRVVAAAKNPNLISERRARRAANRARQMGKHRQYGKKPKKKVLLTILTYAAKGRRVVVDQNNAMAGLAVLLRQDPKWPFAILEERIHGRVAGTMLPDLYHYTKNGVPKRKLKEPDPA